MIDKNIQELIKTWDNWMVANQNAIEKNINPLIPEKLIRKRYEIIDKLNHTIENILTK